MLFVVLKTRLKFPVSGIKCEFFTGDERHANGMEGLVMPCIYLLGCGRSCTPSRISGIWKALRLLSMPFPPLCHVSAQLTTHTSPGPWSTSDSSCLCLSLGPTAHDKIMKLITHIIYGGAPFADGECVNGLQWLINISIFNPVTWMWIHKFASPNSNQDRNMHAIPIP